MLEKITQSIEKYFAAKNHVEKKSEEFCTTYLLSMCGLSMLSLITSLYFEVHKSSSLDYYELFSNLASYLLGGSFVILGILIITTLVNVDMNFVDQYFSKKFTMDDELENLYNVFRNIQNQKDIVIYFTEQHNNGVTEITLEDLDNLKYDLSNRYYLRCSYKIIEMNEKIKTYQMKKAEIAKFEKKIGVVNGKLAYEANEEERIVKEANSEQINAENERMING